MRLVVLILAILIGMPLLTTTESFTSDVSFALNDIPALTSKLRSLIRGREIAAVCVGTDLVGGDCLGPMVGQLLTEAGVPAYVYGTLDNPVTALNVNAVSGFVRLKHPDCLIVAVDSSVGVEAERGRICVRSGPLIPGAAGGRPLNALGDVSVTVITSSALPPSQKFALARLGFVYALAKAISGMILQITNY